MCKQPRPGTALRRRLLPRRSLLPRACHGTVGLSGEFLPNHCLAMQTTANMSANFVTQHVPAQPAHPLQARTLKHKCDWSARKHLNAGCAWQSSGGGGGNGLLALTHGQSMPTTVFCRMSCILCARADKVSRFNWLKALRQNP